ncbi:MAG: hypothetical protein ACPGPE_04285, partial [Planctomycetota bacterium]
RVGDRLGLALLDGELRDRGIEVVHVSAQSGEGVDGLTELVRRRLDDRSGLVDVTAPPGDGRTVAVVRGAGAVLEEEVSEDGTVRMRVRMSPGALGLMRRKAGPNAAFAAADEAAGAWLGLAQGSGTD